MLYSWFKSPQGGEKSVDASPGAPTNSTPDKQPKRTQQMPQQEDNMPVETNDTEDIVEEITHEFIERTVDDKELDDYLGDEGDDSSEE